jgi:hypothetical protein
MPRRVLGKPVSINARLEVVLACRAALRAIPLILEDGLASALKILTSQDILSIVRSLSASLVHAVQPEDTVPNFVFGELSAELSTISQKSLVLPPIWREVVLSARHSVEASFRAEYFASHELVSATLETFITPSLNDGGVTRRSRQALKYGIEHDLEFSLQNATPGGLAHQPLWPLDIGGQTFFFRAHQFPR